MTRAVFRRRLPRIDQRLRLEDGFQRPSVVVRQAQHQRAIVHQQLCNVSCLASVHGIAWRGGLTTAYRLKAKKLLLQLCMNRIQTVDCIRRLAGQGCLLPPEQIENAVKIVSLHHAV